MAVVLAGSLAFVVLSSLVAYALGLALSDRAEPLRRRWAAPFTRRVPEQPTSRPIEAIGADLRRLGARFHSLHPHASFAKVEAVRGAYDRALGECCAALGKSHLLAVLPVGSELDTERERVEELLADCGVRVPRAA